MEEFPIFSPKILYSSNNVRLTKVLFIEHSTDKDRAILTLAKKDKPPLRSLYQLYTKYAIDDPTEVEFALKVFGDVSFWMNLRDAYFIKQVIGEWEEEVERVRISNQLQNILEATKNEKSKMQAAKFLLEHGSKYRPGHTDGRKERKDNKDRIGQVLETEAWEKDLQRLQPLLNEPTRN